MRYLCCITLVAVVMFASGHAFSVFFFFNDTATTEIYTLSLHDALPISSAELFYLNCFYTVLAEVEAHCQEEGVVTALI